LKLNVFDHKTGGWSCYLVVLIGEFTVPSLLFQPLLHI